MYLHISTLLQILQGELGIITTLVEGRDQKKRPTEFKIDQVLQPFNKEKFNFTKVAQEEVIFLFEHSETSGTGYFECGLTTDGSYSPNALLINVRMYSDHLGLQFLRNYSSVP